MCFDNCRDISNNVLNFQQDDVDDGAYCNAESMKCLSVDVVNGTQIENMTIYEYGEDQCYCRKSVNETCDIFFCNNVDYKVTRGISFVTTNAPSNHPTDLPTISPTDSPSNHPTNAPSNHPTDLPSNHLQRTAPSNLFQRIYQAIIQRIYLHLFQRIYQQYLQRIHRLLMLMLVQNKVKTIV